MSVLVTMLKRTAVGTPGYVSIHDVQNAEGSFGLSVENVYVFDKCLKIKAQDFPGNDTTKIKKWACYFEGSLYALVVDIMLTKLSTGYVQAFVYKDKGELVHIDTLGEFDNPNKNKVWYIGAMYKDKLYNEKALINEVRANYMNSSIIQAGTTLQPVQVKRESKPEVKVKYKENMNSITPERLLELKRQIFGSSFQG